jgi:hypothetical protein
MRTRSRMAVGAVVGLAACVGIGTLSVGAQTGESKGRKFLREVGGFSAAELTDVGNGKLVTHMLDTKEKGEVAALGAVYIDAAPSVLIDRAKNIASFRRVPEVLEIGVFSNPARVEDLKGLTFPPDDIDALRRCKPGKCDVKLGAAFAERLAKEVNWSAPDAEAKAVGLAKEAMAGAVKAYQSQGAAALGVAVDKEKPKERAAEMAALLANSPYLFDYVPEFFEYVRSYPKGKREGVSDVFYWTKDNFGLKPTVSIYHVNGEKGDGRALMSQKLLWASHYFNAGLEVWAIAAPPAGKKGFELIMVYRTRLDPPTGMLAGVLMGKVKSGVETGVQQNLKRAKEVCEAK